MMRMAKWVNEFCVVNRVSMNETKSLLFGIDKHGNDLKTPIEIVKQGTIEGPKDTHRVHTRFWNKTGRPTPEYTQGSGTRRGDPHPNYGETDSGG